MKKTLSILLVAFVAALFAGCPAGTETGTNSNENANAEAPAKTVEEAVLEVDKQFSEASKKKDVKFYEANLTDNFAAVTPGGFFDKPSGLKMMSDDKCEPGDSSDSDKKVTEIADGVALLTGKGSSERTCDGKTTKSEEHFAVLFVKDSDTWKAAYYQGKPIPAKEEDKPAAEGEAKKEELPAAPAAKEEPKKEEVPMAPKFASDDELTKALAGKEGELWAAWAKKDIKPFEDAFAADFNEMTSEGLVGRADVLKQIAENKCEVTGTSIGESHAIKIKDDLVLFIYKGSANGKCGDVALGSAYDASIWKKDGDNWKVVFHMESEAAKS
jgi:hypothetical protein